MSGYRSLPPVYGVFCLVCDSTQGCEDELIIPFTVGQDTDRKHHESHLIKLSFTKTWQLMIYSILDQVLSYYCVTKSFVIHVSCFSLIRADLQFCIFLVGSDLFFSVIFQ